jgi:spore germination protein
LTKIKHNHRIRKQLPAYWGWVLFLAFLYPCPPGGGWCYAQDTPADKTRDAPGFWDKLRAALNKEKATPLEKQSVTEQYAPVYNWIHQAERNLYDSLSKSGTAHWNRYEGIVSVRRSVAKDTARTNHLNPAIKVFGWHPYWMKDAYQSYQFELLSHVAWFSYNIDSTGHHDNPVQMSQWKSDSALMKAAHDKHCKVLLTVTNFSASGNRALLTNRNLQATLMDDLIRLLEENNGDGIDLNFENIPDGQKDNMTAFVLELSRRLKTANRNYELTLVLPAYYGEKTCDLSRLSGAIDWFIVTGYDYYGPFSKTDGPVAPLFDPNGGQHIRQSVFRYLQLGVKREQLILGLPYYGALWTGTKGAGGDTTFQVTRQMYRDVRANHRNEIPQYDKERWGAYYSGLDPVTGTFEKCWFDDTLTLKRKFDWVIEEQLAGVGLWALGYDNGYPELWELIENRYAADTLFAYKDLYLEEKHFKLSNSLADYSAIVVVGGIFLVVFLLLGLVVALFDWRVREVFFQHKTLRLLYAFGGIAIVSAMGSFYMYVRHQTMFNRGSWFPLFIGIILGVIMAIYVSDRFEKKRNSMP